MHSFKRLIALILAAALCAGCSCAFAETSFRYEGDGFDTPEEAALCYVAGLKNLDLEQMLSAFAWETQVDHFDFKAYITRLKGIDPITVPGMPVFSDLSRSANIEQFRGFQTNYICLAVECFVNDELINAPARSLVFQEEGELDEYLERCDNGRLESLAEMTNIRIYSPDDVTEGKFSLEQNLESFARENARYGADEVRAVFITFDIGWETYAVSPTVARYGDKWYVVSVSSRISMMLGIDSNHQAFFGVPDELRDLLEDAEPSMKVTELPAASGRRISYEEGFSSPEEAVNRYFEGLKNGDVQQMLSAFAWETQADRYSLKENAEWAKAITYDGPVRMQIPNAFMTELNLGSLRYRQSRRIYTAVRVYIMEDAEKYADLLTGFRINLDEEEVDDFIGVFDNGKAEKLQTLDNVRLIDPGTVLERYNIDTIRNRLETHQRIYGADEIREVLAVAEMDGGTLVFNPVLVRYGEKWYIASVEGAAFFILSIEATRQALIHVNGPVDDFLLSGQ